VSIPLKYSSKDQCLVQHTFSITFGMLSGSNISFWSPFTTARVRGTEKWSDLDAIDFELEIGEDTFLIFKTTAVYEPEAEEGMEPWQEPEKPDVTERPCTWSIHMKQVAWCRTIYLTEEEIRARTPN
jgi:hypothetical protein